MEQEIACLYEKLNTELIRWCRMMTQDEDMAREIVQEGFLRAIDHYGDIQGLDFSRQRAWFYRTNIKSLFGNLFGNRSDEGYEEETPSAFEDDTKYINAEYYEL